MVVFTCNYCGESLHKPRVEKHYYTQCRRPKSLTCVDCFKDFRNEEYVVHTKCLTEEERYAAKGSIPGGIVKKGDLKQESWIDMIKSIVENEANLNPSLRNLFNVISTYTNVPRKKAKFINFLKNSSGGRVNLKDVEAAWNLIEKHKSQSNQNSEATNNNGKHNLEENKEDVPVVKKNKLENNSNHGTGLENNKDKTKKKKKSNHSEDNGIENVTNEVSTKKSEKNELDQSEDNGHKEEEAKQDAVNVENGVKVKKEKTAKRKKSENCESAQYLENDIEAASVKIKKKKSENHDSTQANGHSEEEIRQGISNNEETSFNFKTNILNVLNTKNNISLKKLQKKVLNVYLKETGNCEYTEKTIKKFNKKLRKLPNVIVKDDTVSLINE